jgi:hypothetical protein
MKDKTQRLTFTILTSILASFFCFAQDIITNKSNEEVQAKILEISSNEIRYKKFDNLNGPTFIVAKSEILEIRYENGTKDIFTEEKKNETVSAPTQSNDSLYSQGQNDASRFYRGYSGAGTATLITGLISPLIGLIPAIACSSTSPEDINLNYPNADLMMKPDYNNGYTQKAKKIKQGKVWGNWGVAFGVNLFAVLLLYSAQ